MVREEKLQKDRKILRKIDSNLASHSRYLVAANILVFVFIATVGGYYVVHARTTVLAALALLLLSMGTMYLGLRFESTYGAGPARWRQVYIGLMIATSVYLGTFCASLILLDQISVNSFLITLYIVGYSATNNVEWSPYHKFNVIRLLALFLPTIVAYFAIANINGLSIAVGLLVVLTMLVRQSRLMTIRHWDNVRVHHELHTKARDLSHAVHEANDASQFKTEFLSNITHEIRTPMNNVLGMLALLDDTELSQQQRELQKVAVHSGEALLSLIDDIVDFSRISSGQIQLNEDVFNVKRCIDHTLELLGPRAHEQGMEISCAYQADIPVRVKGDQNRLMQLVNNLVSNAIKYSAGTEITLHVDLTKLSEAEAELKVLVKDNGKGIDAELQDRLFDAFSKKVNYAQGGTGLGLAISKGLAECMHGQIGFESKPETGSEFWFTAHLQLSTQQAQKPAAVRELVGKRVLIVGAGEGVLDSLVSQLVDWEMVVESVIDRDSVVKLLKADQQADRGYHLVLIDLPVTQAIDLQLVEQIRHEPELDSVHLVVLSSLAQRADALRIDIEHSHHLHWLSKPVTQEKLCRALIESFGLDQPLPETSERNEPGETEVDGRRILLVEDNAVSQLVAKGMLNKLGYAVTSVVNGKEALGILEEKVFDLILMDCVMPVLDGYETTQAWRETEVASGNRVPIIAMTASVVEGEQQRCLSCGMDDYLSKPVNVEELSAKIRQWLGAKDDVSSPTESDRKTA
ncbi:response regulator [Ketobacter sp. MCCC 1A13808]|uniref:response regulator n=1 Tax=Ketobacter sp. MCCC 1A13808 TaxID=2602738 RepID=UPI000F14F64E|nr:response regulator [Ketobacter sp. MCCC 1A13808]MVF10624.1 response regulator [Ketobacter sp. MCCC 1A13808]RLP56047.1 MAG: response regulator [Ketobacter sp.]